MSIKEFTQELAKAIEAKVAGISAIPTEALRNNGVIQHGLALRMNEERVSPILYVDEIYKRFKREELSVERIVEQIICTYEDLPQDNLPDMESFLSSPELIDKISVRLLNMERNRELIESRHLVHYLVKNTDLVCIFYIEVINDGAKIGGIALTEELKERYLPVSMNAENLYKEVIARVKEEDLQFESVSKVANRIIENRGFDFPLIPEEAGFLHVLTNQSMIYGAFVILSEAARRMILEKFPDGKATVLPSSLHELILLPTGNESVWMLQSIVRDVNKNQLSAEEILSDQIYHYDAFTGELVIAGTESEDDE